MGLNGERKDTATAAELYLKAAELKHMGAQDCIGLCYYHGEGVKQDYAEAVCWFRKAAEQGHPSAQYHLGYCYEYGKGINQDFIKTEKEILEYIEKHQ